VRDQPHQDGSLATNDWGPPRGSTVGVARAAAQAALVASSTNPPPILLAVGERIRLASPLHLSLICHWLCHCFCHLFHGLCHFFVFASRRVSLAGRGWTRAWTAVPAKAWMGCVVRRAPVGKCAAALMIRKRRRHASQELGVEVVVRGAASLPRPRLEEIFGFQQVVARPRSAVELLEDFDLSLI